MNDSHPLRLDGKQLAMLRTVAGGHAFHIVDVDLAHCHDKRTLLAACQLAFSLPEWFGHNWDALADSLSDLSWLPAQGYLVILQHSRRLETQAHETFATFIDILDEARDTWGTRGVPMQVVLEAGA